MMSIPLFLFLLGLALIALARQVRRDVIRHNQRAVLLPRLYRVCGYHDGGRWS